MTEDEAKTKVCPQTMRGLPDGDKAGIIVGNCIGSACMAWREAVVPAHQQNIYNKTEAPDGEGWQPMSPSARNVAWWRTIPETRVGYCGLAGAPQ